ncbi:MAG: alpha-hydroxy-acid oxidizing protein [Actinomycetota bacterium]|nr:alpha-hydroxy-acid oxidizing protein [Actinomycetota bacterium]
MAADALEDDARRLLPPEVYDYYAGGAFDELSLAANLADWKRWQLRPRVLRDVSAVDTSTTVLGEPVAHPILVAPTAFHRLAHPDGELASARGARQAGARFVLSTRSTTPVEQVAEALQNEGFWYQVYVLRDRELTAELTRRAVAAGATALVLTADVARLGRRLRDSRNGFVLPAHLGTVESLDRPGNLADQDAGLTFGDIGWLREATGLPVLVKGILRGDDARRCVDAGAAAVVVSNHGGRQLDGAISGVAALTDVVEAVAGDVEVYVDGGVRRGTDVIKAVALGATAVLIGRPVLWGLATGGAEGVRAVIDGLVDELELAMALCGCPAIADVTADLVVAPLP